jgi:hypothetical protein
MESHRNSALHGGVCSVGGKWHGGAASDQLRAVAGLASGPPAEDDMEVHEATTVAPSSSAWCLEQRRTAGGKAERRRREQWSGEVKKLSFALKPRRAEDNVARGGARG